MPNALIYSSGFDGHRQVYVFVLANILNELGYEIYIAGNIEDKINNLFYIDKIKENKKITMINTANYNAFGLNINIQEFINMQNIFNISLTIFAEADNHIPLFNSQLFNKKTKFLGKTVGIFLRPFYYYEKLSFINKLRYIKNLKYNWKSDERLFHEILLKHFRLLTVSLNIDENFVLNHSFNYWLPDMFQQYAETLIGEEKIEQRVWITKLNEFKGKNTDRFIFLYFGAAQKRKGYDLLLKLAVELDACFIHCGLRNDNQQYDQDVDEFRKILHFNNRLFETDQYISDPYCIEHFFKSITHLVLPYRDFYGSSGVMLQALSYGIPVLVPKDGIMGIRVRENNLGLTYTGEYNSLIEKFKKFKELSKSDFDDDIARYMETQSISKLKKILVNAFKVNDANLTSFS